MKKPHLPIRILLHVLSAIVCLALTISLLGTAVLLDLKLLTSSGNLQTIITTIVSGMKTEPTPSADVPTGGYIVSLSDTQPTNGVQIPGNVQIPSDIEIPGDVLTDASLLTDYVYDIVKESIGQDTEISKDQVQNFINESTIMDYTAEKAASYIQDAINGEETTTITSEELINLFEENQQLMEQHFDITVTEEMKSDIRTQVEKVVEEDDLNGKVRETINSALDTPLEGADGMTVRDIMEAIGQVTSQKNITSAIVLCLVLILVLMALNYYKLPKGLSWAASSFITVGIPMSILAFALQSTPELLTNLIPQAADLAQTIRTLIASIAPIHYGMLAVGIVLMILSIVWRILAKMHRAAKLITGSN